MAIVGKAGMRHRPRGTGSIYQRRRTLANGHVVLDWVGLLSVQPVMESDQHSANIKAKRPRRAVCARTKEAVESRLEDLKYLLGQGIQCRPSQVEGVYPRTRTLRNGQTVTEWIGILPVSNEPDPARRNFAHLRRTFERTVYGRTKNAAEEKLAALKKEIAGNVKRRRVNLEEYGFVYFIQSRASGAIKIGFSYNVKQRFNYMRCSHWDELVLLAAARVKRKTEYEWQALFKSDRLRGEWYNPSPKILAFVAALLPTPGVEQGDAVSVEA